MATTKRIAWIDVGRGLGIILVVYGHVLRGLLASGLVEAGSGIGKSDYVIYTFHMPLFFVLAGLNVSHSLAKGSHAFFRNKLWTIAYPYFLWSLAQGLLQLAMPSYLNTPRSAWSLATILWKPIGQFWFLYVLFCCHMLALLCRSGRAILITLACISLAAFPFLPPTVLSSLAYSLPFYVSGITLSSTLLQWKPNALQSALWSLAAAAALGVAAFAGRTLTHGDSSAPGSWPAAVAGIFLIIALSHLLVSTSDTVTRWLEVLGKASLTIYIFHVLAAAGTRVLLKRLAILAWQPQLLLGTFAGILIPLLLHILLERTEWLAAFGLAPPRRKIHVATGVMQSR